MVVKGNVNGVVVVQHYVYRSNRRTVRDGKKRVELSELENSDLGVDAEK
jgi:hypothetical protein